MTRTRTKPMSPCVDCGVMCLRDSERCRKCFHATRRTGPSADTRYRRWLLSRPPRVPREVVVPWLKSMLAEYENPYAVEQVTGVDSSSISKLVNGKKASLSLTIAEGLAMACGRQVELAMALPVAGEDGWSPFGRSCGDGSLGFDGCGSWFHSHHEGGLCEECHRREVLSWPIEPRDVRVTRQAREKEMRHATA